MQQMSIVYIAKMWHHLEGPLPQAFVLSVWVFVENTTIKLNLIKLVCISDLFSLFTTCLLPYLH